MSKRLNSKESVASSSNLDWLAHPLNRLAEFSHYFGIPFLSQPFDSWLVYQQYPAIIATSAFLTNSCSDAQENQVSSDVTDVAELLARHVMCETTLDHFRHGLAFIPFVIPTCCRHEASHPILTSHAGFSQFLCCGKNGGTGPNV